MFGVAQEVDGAYFVEGLPVLGFVHCVRLQKFRFSSFRVDIFFLRTCLRHRDQSALAPIVLAFWEKEGKPWGFLRWVRTDVACVFIREYVGFLKAPQS